MRNLKLASRLYLLIGAGLLVGAMSSTFVLLRLSAVAETYDTILNTDVHQQDATRVMQVTFKKEVQEWKNVLLRGHDLEDFKKYKQAFLDEQAGVSKVAADLQKSITDPEIRGAVDEFIAEHATLARKYEAALALFEKSNGVDFQGADALVKGQDRKPTDVCDTIVKKVGQRVDAAQAAQAALIVSQQRIVTIALTLCFGLLAVASVLMARSITKQVSGIASELRASSEQVVAAAGQVSASAQSLSQGATEQAASLEETSASMEEMASMTRNNAKNAEEAARLMASVDRVVGASNEALTDMTQSMASIRESSNKVSKIIKTIDEIAFQTNILALNAAVEAARAGEAGLGFAVVADEVRNLAQRSAQAAKDTAGLIEESIANSQEGNARVEVVAQSVAAITESVSQVKELINEVSEASRQQSLGVGQVAQAVVQMEKVTQSTAANAEESAAASEELNAQAEAAMVEVERLDAMVVGTWTGEIADHAPTRVRLTPAPVHHALTGAARTPPAKRPHVPMERRSPLSPGAALRGTSTRAEDKLPLAETASSDGYPARDQSAGGCR